MIIKLLKIVGESTTGIIPLGKIILLGKPLISKMEDRDIKNLLFHEMAHLKFNHLLIMYVSNIVCCTLSVISASHFYPIFNQTNSPGAFVALHGAIFGMLFVVIPG